MSSTTYRVKVVYPSKHYEKLDQAITGTARGFDGKNTGSGFNLQTEERDIMFEFKSSADAQLAKLVLTKLVGSVDGRVTDG